MISKGLDLLRLLGWNIVSLIFNFIDIIYDIISKVNELDIIGTMANNNIFSSFHRAVVVISISIFALFTTWQFAKKIIEPDENPSINQILMEVFKCGFLILLSTFFFIQVSTFSVELSGYVGSMMKIDNNTTLGSELLINYIDYEEDYEKSENFENDNYKEQIMHQIFGKEEHYNDKYFNKENNKMTYKYKVQWIMAILCGGFFLYALMFSSIMLARRQVEFLFLFLISTIVYATSICNKQRRVALIEQLVSLILQSSVVVLIINITALLTIQINSTIFFSNSFQNMAIKSLLYLGCATFLITGSQTINRFIGSNVSSNSGREQLMSLMGYGNFAKGAGKLLGETAIGTGLLGVGATLKGGNFIAKKTGLSRVLGRASNNILQRAGMEIASFGNSFGSTLLADGSTMSSKNIISRSVEGVGNAIRSHGLNIATNAEMRNRKYEGIGLNKKISRGANSIMQAGIEMIAPLNKIPIPKHTRTNPYLYRKK